MRILVLSFYYTPDLSAGSFRTTALVKSLQQKANDSIHVDVITTLPNRYKSFNSEAMEYEKSDGIETFRIKLPSHKSGFLDQSKAFVEFARKTRALVKNREYDLVYATSSRLMTAALGAWVAKQKKAILYLDIRDIFVDTIKDVLPRKIAFIVKPTFSMIERWTVNQASKVNLVSEGFKTYFETRYPGLSLSFYTNGIDEEFIHVTRKSVTKTNSGNQINVLYAGNMGEGQGLHIIIPELAKKMHNRARFTLIGDGGRKAELQQALVAAGCDNVVLKPPINRDALIQEYLNADVLFLHLNDYPAFRKVLPSKLFEYAALGKPIWGGVAGYAAEFVKGEIENAVIFYPCNANEAGNVFENLKIEDKPRGQFMAKYARTTIMNSMAEDVLTLV